jgi:hypothetical protein
MKIYTYFDLKKKDKKFLWDFGIKNHEIDEYAEKMGYTYFSKNNILEFLSVKHTEWKNTMLRVIKSTVKLTQDGRTPADAYKDMDEPKHEAGSRPDKMRI